MTNLIGKDLSILGIHILKFLHKENIKTNFIKPIYYDKLRDYFLNKEAFEPFDDTMRIFIYVLFTFEQLNRISDVEKLNCFDNILANYKYIFENYNNSNVPKEVIMQKIYEFYLKELIAINKLC